MAIYNPYAVLGVSPLSSLDEIQKAYRQLAKKYHPDNGGGDAKKFSEISEAWKYLQENHRNRKPVKRDYMWRHKTLFKIYKEVY